MHIVSISSVCSVHNYHCGYYQIKSKLLILVESLMIFNNFLSHISFYIFPQITLISHTSLINVLEILGFILGNPFFSSVYFLPAILQLSKFHRLFEAQPLWDLPSDQWKSLAGTHCYHHTAYSMTVYILIYQRFVLIGSIGDYGFSSNPTYSPSLSLIS